MTKKLLYLGNQLNNKGITPTSIETLGSFLEYEGFKVYKYSSVKNKMLRLLDMLLGIFKHQKDTDIILIDTYSTSGFWFAHLSAKLSKLLNLKYVPILRGGDLPKRIQSHPKACQQLFNNAYINIAPSAYLLHHFQEAGYQNLSYIPNTIELQNYAYQERSDIAPKLLWVRSFAQIYNPILALKVLQQLLASYPNAELNMVGPIRDDSIEACKAYATKHSLPVTFTGGMPKADWLQYAQDFDIFINTTNVDNTPVSVIEAMALGLPVVTTNVGGIPYLLEDKKDALLVPKNNVEAMLQSIEYLLDHPSFVEKMTKQARNKVEHFDWEKVKYKWFQILSHDS